MKLLKDLLYTRGNQALDISRLCSLLSVLGFWAGVGLQAWRGEFDPVQTGTGCAAIFAGSAGWIHWRQKHEEPA